MDRRALIHQVLAMRELADSVLAMLAAEDAAPTACEHPAGKREDLRTFGTKGEHWRCTVCGYEQHDDGTEAVDGR